MSSRCGSTHASSISCQPPPPHPPPSVAAVTLSAAMPHGANNPRRLSGEGVDHHGRPHASAAGGAASLRRSSLSPFSGFGRRSSVGTAGTPMPRSPFLSPAQPSPANACLPESRQSLDEGMGMPSCATPLQPLCSIPSVSHRSRRPSPYHQPFPPLSTPISPVGATDCPICAAQTLSSALDDPSEGLACLDCCDHLFCHGCLTRWVTDFSNTCPQCRAEASALIRRVRDPSTHQISADERALEAQEARGRLDQMSEAELEQLEEQESNCVECGRVRAQPTASHMRCARLLPSSSAQHGDQHPSSSHHACHASAS